MASMKLSDVIASLDKLAPFDLAESWDHSGLRLGSPNAQIHSIAFSLDATEQVIFEAAERGCDLLVTHHPLMFSAQENMICDRPDTKAVAAAFSRGVNIVSCHTNLDNAIDGVNDYLAKLIGLREVEPLCTPETEGGFGMGAIGNIDVPIDCDAVCDNAAHAWKLSGYRMYDNGSLVGRIALCGGAGGSLWKFALQKNADIYITADLHYHECLEALDAGLSLMVCDHGEMENPIMKPLSEKVASALGLPVVLIDHLAANEKHNCQWVNCKSQ